MWNMININAYGKITTNRISYKMWNIINKINTKCEIW